MNKKQLQQVTIIILAYIRVAAIQFQIINSPISICLGIILKIVLIPGITHTCISSKITINSQFKSLLMNLHNPHNIFTGSSNKKMA